MPLDISKEITELQKHPGIGQYLGTALQRIQDATNSLGQNTGVDPTGTIPQPHPIQKLDVKTDGNGNVHAVISDDTEVQKGIHYFVEYSTDPEFRVSPHVAHLGVSRSMPPVTLPAKDDDGNPQKFYFRAYSSYPGSEAGAKVHFGGDTPEPVDPGGTMQMTLLPSTGSGTAQNSGQQGGTGYGPVLVRRKTTTAKRQSG